MKFELEIRRFLVFVVYLHLFISASGDQSSNKREQIVRITIENVDVPNRSNTKVRENGTQNGDKQTLLVKTDGDGIVDHENGIENEEEKKKKIKDNIIKKLTKILQKVKEIKQKDLLPIENNDKSPEIIPPVKWHLHQHHTGDKRNHNDQPLEGTHSSNQSRKGSDYFDQSQVMDAGDNVISVETVEPKANKPNKKHSDETPKKADLNSKSIGTKLTQSSLSGKHENGLVNNAISDGRNKLQNRGDNILNNSAGPNHGGNSSIGKSSATDDRQNKGDNKSTKIESHTTYDGGIFHVKWKDISTEINNRGKANSRDGNKNIEKSIPSNDKQELLPKKNQNDSKIDDTLAHISVVNNKGDNNKTSLLSNTTNPTNHDKNNTALNFTNIKNDSTQHESIATKLIPTKINTTDTANNTTNKTKFTEKFNSQTVTVTEKKNYDELNHDKVSQVRHIGDKNDWGNGVPTIDSENKHYWDNRRNTKVNINNVNHRHVFKNFSVNFFYKALEYDGGDPKENDGAKSVSIENKKLDDSDSVSKEIDKLHDSDSVSNAIGKLHDSESISNVVEKLHDSNSISNVIDKLHDTNSVSNAIENLHDSNSVPNAIGTLHDSSSVSNAIGKLHDSDSVSNAIGKLHNSNSVSNGIEKLHDSNSVSNVIEKLHDSNSVSNAIGKLHDSNSVSNAIGKLHESNSISKEIEKLDDKDLADLKHNILNSIATTNSMPDDTKVTFRFNDEGKTKIDISSASTKLKSPDFLERLQTQLRFLKRHLHLHLRRRKKPAIIPNQKFNQTRTMHKIHDLTTANKLQETKIQNVKNKTSSLAVAPTEKPEQGLTKGMCRDAHTSSHANEKDCTRYWLCAGGKRYDTRCPVGLVYNSAISSCDDPNSIKMVSKTCLEKAKRPMSLKDMTSKRNRHNQYISVNML